MQRLNYYKHFPEAIEKLGEIGSLIRKSPLETGLIHLVKLRALQINQCAFCVDMHSKEAKIDNEKELRLYHVAVWEESNLFTPREKAALKWTEAVTKLHTRPISDELFAEVKEHFNDKELTDLNMAVALINTWNRFAAPFKTKPGSADKVYGLDKAGLQAEKVA